MRRYKSPIILVGVVALAGLLPVAAAAQEQGYPFRFSNFKLEFYGGYASFRPDHFNILADFEEAYLQFYYYQRYNAYLPQGCEVNFERTGDGVFRPLQRGRPWGARLKYQLSPTLALAVGLQYLDASQNSRVGLQAVVRDPAGSTITDRYDNPGFGLSVKAWVPQISATFGWNLGRFLRYEVFIAAGPMFVEAKAVTDVHRTYAEASGYRLEYSDTREISGRAKSWFGEVGLVLRIRPAKFFDLFGEAGYAFREAREFSGTGTSMTRSVDSITGEKTDERTEDGSLMVRLVTAQTGWGTFTASTVANIEDWGFHPRPRKFELQLTGFQLKFGLGLRL